MIRRIVDSVVLLDDSGFSQEFIDPEPEVSIVDQQKDGYILVEDDSSRLNSSPGWQNRNLSASSVTSLPDSIYPVSKSTEPTPPATTEAQKEMVHDGETLEITNSYSTGRLSNAVSSYIAPKPQDRTINSSKIVLTSRRRLTQGFSCSSSSSSSSSSSPSLRTNRRTRRQSPSPNASPHANRQLPSSLHATRPNRFTKPPTRTIAGMFGTRNKEPPLSERLATMELFNPELASIGQMKPTESESVGTSEHVSSNAQTKKDEVLEEETLNCVGTGVMDCSIEMESGTAMQADPLMMSVECMVLPFVQDLTEVEFRLAASRLNAAQRRILKMLAREHDFTILTATAGASKASWMSPQTELVLRKRTCLIQRQQVELERRREAAQERIRQLAEKKRQEEKEAEVREKLRREAEVRMSLPKYRESSCQFTPEEPKVETSRKQNRRRRQDKRRLAWQAKKERELRPKHVDCASQTVPEDHWLCPWCLQHIAPLAQCGHEAICRAGVKQREMAAALQMRLDQRNAGNEARRRQRIGMPVTKRKEGVAVPAQLAGMSGRSRSRTRLVQRTKGKNKSLIRQRSSSRNDPNRLNSAVAKLDTVHPNDLGAMTRLMQRLCSAPGCHQVAVSAASGSGGGASTKTTTSSGRIKCVSCRRIFCDRHRPVGLHTDCPALKEAQKSKEGEENGIACGMDWTEKKAALKSAMRQRRTMLMERRQRC